MSTDEPADSEAGEDEVRNRPAVETVDEGLVELLAWLLDTETRARIYVFLRMRPARTSGEVADGTGLYPSTVRECLAAMHDEGLVTRTKRASEGAGNNPYEYRAIPPSDLVADLVADIQDQLNAICNLDRHLGEPGADGHAEPVRIRVVEEPGD